MKKKERERERDREREREGERARDRDRDRQAESNSVLQSQILFFSPFFSNFHITRTTQTAPTSFSSRECVGNGSSPPSLFLLSSQNHPLRHSNSFTAVGKCATLRA